jgi:hypothetical protein
MESHGPISSPAPDSLVRSASSVKSTPYQTPMAPKVTNLQPAIRTLSSHYPWTSTPLIVQAPMRILSGPKLAVAVSEAGGFGFVGPGEKPEDLRSELDDSVALVSQSKRLASHLAASGVLPIGFGVQIWNGDLAVTCQILREVAESHPPAAIWLFAPRKGRDEAAAVSFFGRNLFCVVLVPIILY